MATKAKKSAKERVRKIKPAVKTPEAKPIEKTEPFASAGPTPMQRSMGIVAYLWILFIIPLIANRNDEFIHFHARQGMLMFLVSIAILIFMLVPYLGWILGPLLLIALIVFWIIAIVNVIMGRKWLIPLIGGWASRLDL